MKKRELRRRIEELEARLQRLEGRGPGFHVFDSGCNCGTPWWGMTAPPPCPVHGPHHGVTVTAGDVSTHGIFSNATGVIFGDKPMDWDRQ